MHTGGFGCPTKAKARARSDDSIQGKLGKHIGAVERFPGRAVKTEFQTPASVLHIICIYVPSSAAGEDAAEVEELSRVLDQWIATAFRHQHQVVILGDLNGVMCPQLDRLNGIGIIPDSLITRMLSERALFDLWRIDHPASTVYTYHRSGRASRIDYILASEGITASCLGTAIALDDMDLESDHRPIFAEISGVRHVVRLHHALRPSRLILNTAEVKADDWHQYRELSENSPEDLQSALETLD